MKHVIGGFLAALWSATVLADPQWVIVNAKVFTGDPVQPQAEALAIEGGKFRAVGASAEIRALAGPATRVIDAGGRLVIPGLVEAHVHLGWNLPSPPLQLPGLPFPGPSGEQTLAAVAEAAKAPGDWISAWIGQGVARDSRNWRNALDAVAPDRPVLLRGFWGHTTIVNSAALKRLGIPDDVPDPLGGWWGRDADGRLDGHAHQGAEDLEPRAAPPDSAQLKVEFREAGQRYARWGVTSIHLMNSGRSLDATLDGLARAQTSQKWTVYSWARHVPRISDAWAAIDAAPKTLPPRVRIDGPKFILDGTPIEQNAFRREPYPGRPDWRGRSNYQGADLREILATALRRPEQLALHVVGDAETDRLLQTMESLGSPEAWKSKRVRVEHGDGIRRDTLDQAVRLGVVVTQNPLHQGPPPPAAEPSLTLLGSLLTGGVPLALGSDAGPDEANPFLNIMMATTYRSSPREALTREQALLAYTSGGAFAERQERVKGRIMPGMAADLAVLSQDILLVPAQALPATRSLLTLVDGEIAFEDPGLTAPAVRIDPAAMLRHIEVLASDAFEGRKPGTRGEALTVDYLVDTFKRNGLAPGNPDGTYIQEVPLTGITSRTTVALTRGGDRVEWQGRRDFVGGSHQRRALIRVQKSELVFVGHGVVAPEYDWDDYKGVDLRGKTVVMLMDDPQVPDPVDPRLLDPSMFKGAVKTYYSTGMHKREAAVPRGAVARITVHEAERAGGAPFSVYANDDGREDFTLRDDTEPQFEAELFIPVEHARELFRRAGQDLDALRERANRRDFTPIALGVELSIEVRNSLREVRSRNVVARVQGRDPTLKDEVVLYSAHWDHLGRDPALKGDPIYHGALDNASGVAAVIEIAKSYASLPMPPARSLLFIATTGEEAGLLGARHYAAHPLVPLAQTLADLNLDVINAWGRTADVQITGWGESDLDPLLMEVAAAQGKRAVPDQAPELGLYYRQDAFEFARAGVPSLYVRSGIDFIGKPPGYRREKVGAYLANDYHQVTDTVRADWDLTGGAEQAEFAFAVGWRLADGAPFPQWRPGAEFKARRDATLGSAR